MDRPALRPIEYSGTVITHNRYEIEIIDTAVKFICEQLMETRAAELTMVFHPFMIQGRLSAEDDLKITVAKITHEGETHVGRNCLACGSEIHPDGTCVTF